MVSGDGLSKLVTMLTSVLPFPPLDVRAYSVTIKQLLPSQATDEDLMQAYGDLAKRLDKCPAPAQVLEAVRSAMADREQREASSRLRGMVSALDQFGREWVCRPDQIDSETGLYIGRGHDELGVRERPALGKRSDVDAAAVLDRLAIRKSS